MVSGAGTTASACGRTRAGDHDDSQQGKGRGQIRRSRSFGSYLESDVEAEEDTSQHRPVKKATIENRSKGGRDDSRTPDFSSVRDHADGTETDNWSTVLERMATSRPVKQETVAGNDTLLDTTEPSQYCGTPRPSRDGAKVQQDDVRKGIDEAEAKTEDVKGGSKGACANCDGLRRLLVLYEEKELNAAQARKLRTRIREGHSDVAKLEIAAARFHESAKHRAVIIRQQEEQEKGQLDRVQQKTEEIRALRERLFSDD